MGIGTLAKSIFHGRLLRQPLFSHPAVLSEQPSQMEMLRMLLAYLKHLGSAYCLI